MPWILTNDRNYLRRNSHNEMKACSNANKATTFDTYEEVEKAIMSLSRKMRQLSYHPVFIEELEPKIDEAEPEETENLEMDEPVAEMQGTENSDTYRHRVPGVDDDILGIDVFVEQTTKFANFLQSVVEQKPILSSANKQADLEIQDILHGIEFSKCNVVGGYQWYKMLQDALRRRREYKDALQCAEYLAMLNVAVGDAQHAAKSCEGLKHRKYTPRVLSELNEYFQGCRN